MCSHMVSRPTAIVSARAGVPAFILCVDPDEAVCRALSVVLLREAVTVECVHTVRDALALLGARSTCTLLIASHEIRGSSGLVLVREARSAGFAGRVVITCAGIDRRRAAAYRALGVAAILLKPVPAALLRAASEATDHPDALAPVSA